MQTVKRLALFIKGHLAQRQLIILLALLIGFFSSVAAVALHWLIDYIRELLTEDFHITSYNLYYLLLPVIGIVITSLFVRYVVKDNISHGITRILLAISTKQSHIKAHNCWSSLIASAITIGFGGSVGAEAPIVLTGSAIGSNLGRLFKTDNKTLMLLVGCGAAAAIAGIFKAPIAGLVFTFEVLMVDLSMASLLPILTSSVTATCFTFIFSGSSSLFQFQLDNVWTIERIPASVMLGIACGLVSLYFIRAMAMCEDIYAHLKPYPVVKLCLGGIILSSLIFLFPSLYGEGYDAINILLGGSGAEDWNRLLDGSIFYGQDELLLLYVAFVLLTKVFATSATNGAGGVGGTFAPSLFIGCFAGFFFARLWNIYDVGAVLPEKNFALLGMAGVMAGVMHAPLTGIFLIAEITAGYSLLIPLMIVSLISVLVISIFEPHSIYAMRLARQGKLITHHTDRAALTLMTMRDVMENDYLTVTEDMSLGKLTSVLSKSRADFVPVVNNAGELRGDVVITKLRHIIFRTELYNRFTVAQLMTPVAATIIPSDPMDEVARKFELENSQYLPVCTLQGILLGYISRVRFYSLYKKTVEDLSAE